MIARMFLNLRLYQKRYSGCQLNCWNLDSYRTGLGWVNIQPISFVDLERNVAPLYIASRTLADPFSSKSCFWSFYLIINPEFTLSLPFHTGLNSLRRIKLATNTHVALTAA